MITHQRTLVPELDRIRRGSKVEIEYLSSDHQSSKCSRPYICINEDHFLTKTVGEVISIYSTSFSDFALNLKTDSSEVETFYLDEDYVINIKNLNEGE